MSEQEPVLPINIGGEELELHRWNTAYYSFFGELACYDHVFIVTQDTPERQEGFYLWQTGEQFDEIRDFIMENDLPAHTGMPEVGQMDREAWAEYYLQNFTDTFPKAWSKNESQEA